jgi:hypothetical protein
MVVVDNARKMISKTIDVVVTSVLQTTAGKMIFGRFLDPGAAAAQAATQGAGPDESGARRARQGSSQQAPGVSAPAQPGSPSSASPSRPGPVATPAANAGGGQ